LSKQHKRPLRAVPKNYYKPDTFRPRRAIGYLIRRLHNLIVPHAEALFADEEITFSQWVALVSLRDGLTRTCADIARHLGHDSGATTRLVDQLEARGFLKRTRSKEDRRVVYLTLTAQGRAAAKALTPRILEFWNRVLEDFTVSEANMLIDLLTRLLAAVEGEIARGPQKGRSAP
jgi:DNA-binding MarR family transcriptional regulator